MGKRTPPKYRNQKVVYDGIGFDSKREKDRYVELRLLQKAGEITYLVVHPRFALRCGEVDVKIRSSGYPNGRKVAYFADFSYYDHRREQRIVEDVKGFDTPVSRLKRAFIEAQYGVLVEIVR